MLKKGRPAISEASEYLLFCKSEAYAPNGIDIFIVRYLLYLSPYIGDMNIDRLVLSDIILIPGILENVLLGEHLCRMKHKEL